jgi:mannose/fructose-specific phosphotransferase system component IIA
MNKSAPAVGILLAHGAMAEGIVDAVRRITGVGPEVLMPLSNQGLSPAALADTVRAHVGSGPTLLFTDLQSGSCGFAARMLLREIPGLVVISGVNLPLLLEFVLARELPIEELVPRLLTKGRAALGCAPASLESHADRAVSGG